MSNSTVSKFWEDVETAKLSGDFVDLSESAQASAFAPEFGDRDELIHQIRSCEVDFVVLRIDPG